ncbi:MAG: hypothetical protein VKJ02_04410 [Snowella sp.]|nr:hypothetical protein [Snowella sp.]
MIQLPITLEQLITTVQQLQPSDRAQVAKALIQIELKSDLTNLLEELYSQTPIDEITDTEIMNEIKAVRQQSRNST